MVELREPFCLRTRLDEKLCSYCGPTWSNPFSVLLFSWHITFIVKQYVNMPYIAILSHVFFVSFDSPFESPFSLVVTVVAVSGLGKGWIPKNFAKGESLKSVCRTHPVVAVGNASVKGSASSAKPNTEITVPPNKVRSAKASNGAKATSPTSPRPGNRNVASPAVACCMHAVSAACWMAVTCCIMLYMAETFWDCLEFFKCFI